MFCMGSGWVLVCFGVFRIGFKFCMGSSEFCMGLVCFGLFCIGFAMFCIGFGEF